VGRVAEGVRSLSVHGRVLTLDAATPQRERLDIANGHVVSGPPGRSAHLRLPEGAVVVPGFVDPHLHVLAAAAARLSIDVGAASSSSELMAILQRAAARQPGRTVIRAVGLDDVRNDRLVPTRVDLDTAVPDRPVVLHHRSGHLAVLNSAALQLAGIDEPSGLIAEPGRRLAALPRLDATALRTAVSDLSTELAARGVTAITDASHTNGLDEAALLAGLADETVLLQHLEVMIDARAADRLSREGLGFGSRLGVAQIGHLKVIAGAEDEVESEIIDARRRRWPVAVHVIDLAPLARVLDALRSTSVPGAVRDRLEHVALSLPEQVRDMAAAGVSVVTQPAFVTQRGGKYRRELSLVEQAWLYRVRSLIDAGIPVAASSDAPVAAASPLESLEAAVYRRDRLGVIGPRERVDRTTALRLVTSTAGAVGSKLHGVLRHGADADFVVLDRDPTTASSRAQVLLTVIRGTPVYGDLLG